jgi:hypothetical protein
MIIAAGPWYVSGAFWEVAAPCAAAILAAALGAWIARWRPRRLLVFAVSSRSLLAERSAASLADAGLQVTYQGSAVTTPVVVALSLLNKGRTEILPDDFQDRRPFTFDLGTQILGVLDYEVPGFRDQADNWFQTEESKIRIGPRLIQKSQAISMNILTREPPPRIRYESNLAETKVRESKPGPRPVQLRAWMVTAAMITFAVAVIATALIVHTSAPPAARGVQQASATIPDMSLINPQYANSPPQLQSASSVMTNPFTAGVTSVAYSRDGSTLTAGDINGFFAVWNLATERAVRIYDPSSLGVYAVSFSQNGQYFATGDGNGNVYLWSQTFGFIGMLPCPQGSHAPCPAGGAIRSVTFSADSQFLAAGDINGAVYIWNTATRKLVNAMTDPNSQGVYAVAFSQDGSYLAAGDGNGNLYLWRHGQYLTLPISQNGVIRAVAFSPDGDYLAVGDGDGYAYVLSTIDDKIIDEPTVKASDGIDAVAFSADNTYLAIGDADGHLYLWTQTSGSRPVLAVQSASSDFPETGAVTSVSFSPNGRRLVAGSSNGHLYQWNAAF